jgi:tetratricopeptide (TPR) repeat protein
MAEQQAPKKPPLDEVMLAMDVVDTLRHSDRLVERELNAEERDKRLMARLRQIYTSQGIEVSDRVLAEGVAALKEERFRYEAPESSLQVKLAHLYVDRGRWGKVTLAVVAALVIVLGAVQGFKFYQAKQQQALATEVASSWKRFEASKPEPQLQAAGEAIYGRAQASLKRGDADTARDQLAQLTDLAKFQEQWDAVMMLAKEPGVRPRAEEYFSAGIAALRAGDARQAREYLQRLQALKGQLEQEFVLHIVSRPGQPSGVWREPAANPGARNFYLIVEALGPDGRPLELAVTSEEDGSTKKVSEWGLRVDEGTFAQVRADKQDDGIIANARVGVKSRGFLEPEYLIPAPGGAITSW